jgi:hypothetical protein
MDMFDDIDLSVWDPGEDGVYLTTLEAAAFAGVSRQTIHRWVHRELVASRCDEHGTVQIEAGSLVQQQVLRAVTTTTKHQIGTLRRWGTTDD